MINFLKKLTIYSLICASCVTLLGAGNQNNNHRPRGPQPQYPFPGTGVMTFNSFKFTQPNPQPPVPQTELQERLNALRHNIENDQRQYTEQYFNQFNLQAQGNVPQAPTVNQALQTLTTDELKTFNAMLGDTLGINPQPALQVTVRRIPAAEHQVTLRQNLRAMNQEEIAAFQRNLEATRRQPQNQRVTQQQTHANPLIANQLAAIQQLNQAPTPPQAITDPRVLLAEANRERAAILQEIAFVQQQMQAVTANPPAPNEIEGFNLQAELERAGLTGEPDPEPILAPGEGLRIPQEAHEEGRRAREARRNQQRANSNPEAEENNEEMEEENELEGFNLPAELERAGLTGEPDPEPILAPGEGLRIPQEAHEEGRRAREARNQQRANSNPEAEENDEETEEESDDDMMIEEPVIQPNPMAIGNVLNQQNPGRISFILETPTYNTPNTPTTPSTPDTTSANEVTINPARISFLLNTLNPADLNALLNSPLPENPNYWSFLSRPN